MIWKKAAQDAALDAARRDRFPRMRQMRWDKEHIRTASCRLRTEEMERLRRECQRQGTTVYGLLRYMITVYLYSRRNW